MRQILFFLVAIFMFAGMAQMADAQTVTLNSNSRFCWDHDGVDLAGFELLTGTVSGTYDTSYDVGMASPGGDFGSAQGFCAPQTVGQMGIPDGVTHWNVRAYDAASNFSPPNGEVVSDPLDLTPPNSPFNLGIVSGS